MKNSILIFLAWWNVSVKLSIRLIIATCLRKIVLVLTFGIFVQNKGAFYLFLISIFDLNLEKNISWYRDLNTRIYVLELKTLKHIYRILICECIFDVQFNLWSQLSSYDDVLTIFSIPRYFSRFQGRRSTSYEIVINFNNSIRFSQ